MELSHKTGIDKEEIVKMENGEIPVMAFNLNRIAKAFNVTVEFILRHKK